jgi:hypothetical protein
MIRMGFTFEQNPLDSALKRCVFGVNISVYMYVIVVD